MIPTSSPPRPVRLAVAIGIAAATIAAYLVVLKAEFTTFDDPGYVTQNDRVIAGLSFRGVIWAFRTGHAANWHPLTWVSHMLDAQIWGLDPRGHHATNLLIHAASAVLLLLVLDRMTRAFWPSALVAALFALHPTHVESVAWVAERKDVLSTFLFLCTLLAYARYAEAPCRSRYLVVLGVYALGLMAKPMLVTLPFVLLLLDFWPLRRMNRWKLEALVREKIPFVVLAAGASVTTYFVQKAMGAMASNEVFPLTMRVNNAIISYARYLEKTAWPVDLAVYYPHPQTYRWALASLALAGLALVTGFAWRARERRPWFLTGWLWFLGTLVPVIGIVQVGSQAMADRYTYIPTIGVYAVIAFGARELFGARRWLGAAIFVPILVALSFTTAHQAAYWHDTRKLFEHTVAITTENALAHQSLGNALLDAGDIDGAIVHLEEALRIAPDFPDAHNNLGTALGSRGRLEEAIRHFRAALRTQPKSAETHYNLAFALGNAGRFDEAIPEYAESVRLDPDRAVAHAKFGMALAAKGRTGEALEQLRTAVKLAPWSAEMHQFLAVTLSGDGRIDAALEEFEKARKIDPDQAGLRRETAVLLIRAGRVEEAIAEYRALLKAQPEDLDALNNIAWIRATHADPAHRDGAEAVELAEKARDLAKPENAILYDTLAAAYAEAGRFEEAIAACEKAIALAQTSGAAGSQAADVARFRVQLELFRSRRPFHNE